MNRFLIAVISLSAIFAVCMYSSFTIEDVKLSMESGILEIYAAAERQDSEAVLQKLDKLHEYWSSKERLYANIVRKNLVETISQSMMRLYPLAKLEDWPSLLAELASISWLIDNINSSEKFTISNIF